MAMFIPAILETTKEPLCQQVAVLKSQTSRIHIDLADGSLVPSQTVLPTDLSDLQFSGELDAHLMVDQPTLYLTDLVRLGFHRAIVHFEAAEPLDQVKAAILEAGLSYCLAINPDTEVESVAEATEGAELLLIMGVDPGFGGQPFQPATLDRIRVAHRMYPNLPIAVDGGVRLTNAEAITGAGAEILIAGKGGYEGQLPEWQQLVGVPNH